MLGCRNNPGKPWATSGDRDSYYDAYWTVFSVSDTVPGLSLSCNALTCGSCQEAALHVNIAVAALRTKCTKHTCGACWFGHLDVCT